MKLPKVGSFKASGTKGSTEAASIQEQQALLALQQPTEVSPFSSNPFGASPQQQPNFSNRGSANDIRYLSYSPQEDPNYQHITGLSAFWSRLGLWLLQVVPTINPKATEQLIAINKKAENAEKDATATALVATEPLSSQQAIRLLNRAEALLGQYDDLSKEAWLLLSLDLSRLIQQDVALRQQQQMASGLGTSEAALLGLLVLVQQPGCPKLYSFATTAFQANPHWQNVLQATLQQNLEPVNQDDAATYKQLPSLMQALLYLLAQRAIENACLQQVRLQLAQLAQAASPSSLNQWQDTEMAPLWLAPSQLGTLHNELSRLDSAIAKQLCLSLANWQQRYQRHSELTLQAPLLRLSIPVGSNEPLGAFLNALTTLQKDKQQNIQALMALILASLAAQPHALQALQHFSEKQLKCLPNASFWLCLLSLWEAGDLPKEGLSPLINWLESSPKASVLRLAVGSRLLRLLGTQPSQALALQQKLLPSGITQKPIQNYDWTHWRGVKRRLESVLFGQDQLYLALMQQLRHWNRESKQVPCLTLFGPSGSGKTYVTGQLALAFNGTSAQEELAAQPERCLAPEVLWPQWNTYRLDMRLLASHNELVAFKYRLHEWLLQIHQQARQAPGRPLLIVWDNMDALALPPFCDFASTTATNTMSQEDSNTAEEGSQSNELSPLVSSRPPKVRPPTVRRVPQLNYLYEKLRELKSFKRYTSPFTGEVWEFQALMLVFHISTSDAAHFTAQGLPTVATTPSAVQTTRDEGEEAGLDGSFTLMPARPPAFAPVSKALWNPLLQLEECDPANSQLFAPATRVQLQPLGGEALKSWLTWLFDTYLSQVAALRLYELQVSKETQQALLALFQSRHWPVVVALQAVQAQLVYPITQLPMALSPSLLHLELVSFPTAQEKTAAYQKSSLDQLFKLRIEPQP